MHRVWTALEPVRASGEIDLAMLHAFSFASPFCVFLDKLLECGLYDVSKIPADPIRWASNPTALSLISEALPYMEANHVNKNCARRDYIQTLIRLTEEQTDEPIQWLAEIRSPKIIRWIFDSRPSMRNLFKILRHNRPALDVVRLLADSGGEPISADDVYEYVPHDLDLCEEIVAALVTFQMLRDPDEYSLLKDFDERFFNWRPWTHNFVSASTRYRVFAVLGVLKRKAPWLCKYMRIMILRYIW